MDLGQLRASEAGTGFLVREALLQFRKRADDRAGSFTAFITTKSGTLNELSNAIEAHPRGRPSEETKCHEPLWLSFLVMIRFFAMTRMCCG
jgi:hypothetical protein